MKVWELNSPRDVERLILEQDLIIKGLRESNQIMSDRCMYWMSRFADAKAEAANLEDLLGGAWTRVGELESQFRSLENEMVAVLDMYGK
jgi:hypothetical protein